MPDSSSIFDTSTLMMIVLTAYVIATIPIFGIAKRLGHEYAWMAFVPIANAWLLVDLADKPAWWMVLLLVPYVNIIFLILVFMGICEALNKDMWLALLWLVPVVNLIFLYWLAFCEQPKQTRY